jgi:transposase
MSLHAQARYEVPEETARIARTVYTRGDAYIQLYDTFGTLFEDEEFAVLFPNDGQPALLPMRLSLVLIL